LGEFSTLCSRACLQMPHTCSKGLDPFLRQSIKTWF
jgi:hypothetical protein